MCVFFSTRPVGYLLTTDVQINVKRKNFTMKFEYDLLTNHLIVW